MAQGYIAWAVHVQAPAMEQIIVLKGVLGVIKASINQSSV